jgi:hypothetical protein
MEKILVGFERVLPSTDVNRFLVTEDLVQNPRPHLQDILENECHPSRCELFEQVDSCEKSDIICDLESRAAEFEKRFGRALSGWELDIVVQASSKQGVQPETAYGRFISVDQQIRRFEKEFAVLYGLKIRFSDEALRDLIALVLNGSEEPLIICRKIFQNYHHGLKLVMERTGSHEFTIPREAIENPEKYLNEMIQQTYRLQDRERTDIG